MMLLLAAAVGCALGAAYSGYLWLDVRRAVERRRVPSRTGTFLRAGGIALALTFLSRTGPASLVTAFAGLILVRSMVVWRIGRAAHA
jgi:F1F0 ATPase subunit 2